MWKNCLKMAWRNLIGNQKIYNITNALGLTLTVTAVLLISLWIQNELRYDNYHADAERIYLIKNTYQYENGNSDVTDYSPHHAVHFLEQEIDNIEAVAYATRSIPLDVMHQQETYHEPKALYISDRWFDVFHYDFITGNRKAAFDHTRSLIITERKALQYFGSTDVIGRTLEIDSTDYSVQGVIKDIPSNSSMPFDILIPFEDPTVYGGTSDWINFTTQIFVRLKANSDYLQTTQLVQRIFDKNIQYVQQGITVKCQLLPLRKLHFDQELSATAFRLGNLQTVYIFFGFVALLLVAASINYINISIARTLSRSKEIGTRKVAGATKGQLFLQMMVEAFLNSTLSLFLALLMVYLLLPNFNAFFKISLQISLINAHIAVLICVIWTVLILLIGIYPAIYLSSFNPTNLFRGTGAFQYGGRNIRRALLVGQFVLAVFMVIAGTTMYNQMAYIQHKDTAYNRSQVFSMQIPSVDVADVPVSPQEDLNAFSGMREQMESSIRQTLKEEIQADINIKNVSIITPRTVLNENHTMVGLLDWSGKDPNFQPQYVSWSVDDDFAQMFGLSMAEGRWFLEGENNDGVIILNETAVRDFAIPEPVIGQQIKVNRRVGIIVGVVKDFHFQDMRQRISPLVISKKPFWGGNMMVQTQPSASNEALSAVEAIFKRHFPKKAFSYRFVDEEFDELYRKDKQTLMVTLSFFIISIVLSFLGLLGMIFFDIQQRIKEIGIRKVLGASDLGIVQMLSSDFVKLVGIAILIASPIAWYAMNRWLADFAYRIDIEWWMFGIAGLMAVMIALLTVSFQAVRAAGANPVESLRSE